MTSDQIEQMAREGADMETDWRGRVTYRYGIYELTRFAQAVRAAALEEAAKVCLNPPKIAVPGMKNCWQQPRPSKDMADAIRALAQQAGGEQGGEKP